MSLAAKTASGRDWSTLTALELENALLRYADDIESEGRAYAPACMREVAQRLHAATEALRRDWAARVLAAYDRQTGKQTRWEPFSISPLGTNEGEICPNNGLRYSGTRESASISAADSVWRELPESERKRIGERP